MNDLMDKIILITGASSGIGQACAQLCAKYGARLILCARRVERLEQLAKELKQLYGKEHYILPLDVREHEQVKKQLAALPSQWQSIEILINNAGLALDTLPVQQGIEEHWDIMIDTNIKGLLYVSRALIPGMLERGYGHVVNIGSIAGHECYPNGNVYCATKHAVHALSKTMRLDMLGSPVRVTEIAPGAVETEFSEVRWKDKEKAKEFYSDFQPLLAEDIADAIVYCITRPLHVDIEEMIIMPTVQASANHLSKMKNR
ncbi:SDR family NAD(P)-dependent oxidoreductase [Legionella longbeachae]|uniref:L-allo-threonine dehydrogenase, NAD(P)-binding n=1 Tax=Legionella longbeachae serogroup 1 (strain NSW150) TaxID=661367 RepID=D3HPH1_LEGLN|nr:SDR family NAD(P)-dependent oxidoreductase [Legionella longbeachae]VEE01311.1 L-allo-threonine dehydrogenase, NAD(P)-binding [Legionella oakridgensis]HBD7398253.1 SDR family NAD(P)-dependent oxidoreductase [Legionella pneumophila]ARB92324.1 KR domain-containing protein [Legionella longbeachae]ARM34495.1 SDR family NAD(P)-dependent oxidoreductase [Legionella longbeachae]EEZ96209.1 serine 3-dehydrogenase [Legionella longbeachae D-4968]